MSIKEQISADLKEAMKAREQLRVDTLRGALSAFTYKRTETGKDELSLEDELAVLQKQVKQRNDYHCHRDRPRDVAAGVHRLTAE